jgi:glycosyltransferase involved in cell wall biosynthesis
MSRPLKIALVAPLIEAVPPKLYGGTERIVAYLADSLVSQGHNVTLFATGDSHTTAILHPTWPCALRLFTISDVESPTIYLIATIASIAQNFDVIHLHNGFILVPLLKALRVPHIVTLHHGMDKPEIHEYRKLLWDTPVVSISNSQRRREIQNANYLATIYHGIPPYLSIGTGKREYLAFLGRIESEKGPETAIRIAEMAGLHIKIAAKIDVVDRAYFEKEVKHLFELPFVEYLGEIREEQKNEFLGNAKALLFPIRGEEPFGIVLVEAMMCGTPVIAFPRGSVREIVDDGVTGFLVNNEKEAVDAIGKVESLDKEAIREVAMRRFQADRMADEYVKLYRQQLQRDQDTGIESEDSVQPRPV